MDDPKVGPRHVEAAKEIAKFVHIDESRLAQVLASHFPEGQTDEHGQTFAEVRAQFAEWVERYGKRGVELVDAGWQLAHDPASCGHPRACWLDRNYPLSEKNYNPETRSGEPPMDYRCVMCELQERLDAALKGESWVSVEERLPEIATPAQLERLTSVESIRAYVSSKVTVLVASQIHAMRLRRSMKQKELAELCGMKQSRISDIETPGYSNVTLATLSRIAASFGVGMTVNFCTMKEMLDWENNHSPDDFNPQPLPAPPAQYKVKEK